MSASKDGDGPSIRLRPASRDDAADLARLVDLAGEGMPRRIWAEMAEPGEDVWDVGRRRAARDEGAFSWRNATMAEIGGRTAGALIAYRIAEAPAPVDDLPPMFRPLQELENRAPGSHYINVLATYRDFRRRGVASLLLAAAEAGAREAGAPEMSLIVADGNASARQLYANAGYAVRARAPLVADGWSTPSTEWLLMVRPATR